MYQVSKRLQAVKKRLNQMDQCSSETEIYRDELEDSTHKPSDMEPKQELRNRNLSPRSLSNKELHDTESTMPFNSDNLPVMTKINTDDEIPLSEELKCALSSLQTDDTISNTDDVMSFAEELGCALSSLEEIDHASSNGNEVDELKRTLSSDATLNRDDVKPISEDLQCTLFSVEEIDDIIDLSDHVNNSSVYEHQTYSQCNEPYKISTEDEDRKRRERRKKDNHNRIERKRRYNINDRIQELASLLPETDQTGFHMKKGSILKAAVKYVKDLKKDQERLQFLETVQSKIKFKQQKMLKRIFQLELKVNLYRLSSNSIDFTKTKREKKRSLEKIDRIVECFFKGKVSSSSSILETAEKSQSLKTHRGRRDPANTNLKKGCVLQTSSSNNSCQEIHLSSKLPTLITDGHEKIYNPLTSTWDISDSDSDIECLPYTENDVSSYRKNYYLDMAQNATCIFKLNDIDTPIQKISTAECVTPNTPQDTLSPSSFHTSMLENLLRRSKIVSGQNVEYCGLESSIGTSSSNP